MQNLVHQRIIAIKEARLNAAYSNNIAALRARVLHEMEVLVPHARLCIKYAGARRDFFALAVCALHARGFVATRLARLN